MPPTAAPTALPPDADASPAVVARRALATRDRGAVARIARDYGPVLRGVVRRILARHGFSTDLEEDILQEIFVALLREDCAALASWDPSRGPLETYLRYFARSRAIDQLRRRGRDVATDDDRIASIVDERGPAPAGAGWLDDALHRYRDECSEEDWQFLLAVVEGKDTPELETIFHVNAAAIYKRKQRLRDRLRELQRASTADGRGGDA